MKKLLLLFIIYCYSVTTIAQKCSSGDCLNGIGTFVFENGNSYSGSWKDGNFEGKGTYTWINGDVYIGDWVANIRTGNCLFNYADGTKYLGKMKNGFLDGEGNYILTNGYSMKGIFKENIGIDVKYFDANNNPIANEIFWNSVNKEKEKFKHQNKGKLQIQSITIPAPNGVYTMTDRAEDVKMQFSSSTKNFLYLWGIKPNVITINDAKVAARSSYETLTKTDFGREVLTDFNKSSSTTNESYSPHFKQKGDGYANKKFQIKINKGKPFGINNDSTYTVTLYNYQKFIDEETISNFSFWKNAEERKEYHKKQKEEYFDSFTDENSTKSGRKSAKDEYEKNSRTKLTDIHASYDSIKSLAHVVFTFSHLRYGRSYNVFYDINFKNKTYKKVGESDYQATVNDDCYYYLASITQDQTTKEWFRKYKIINFENYSIIDIDKAYAEKLNNLTNPAGDVEFVTANKEYLLFKSYAKQKIVGSDAFFSNAVSYYFVNKSNNFCEKIVNINHQSIGNKIVFNSDFSYAAFSQNYRLNPNDSNYVNSVYVIDFDNLTVKLIDDHQYQMEAINNKIIQDKEDALQAAIKSQEVYNRNAEITRQNAEIEAQNAQAKAERRAKCTCCHGTGQVTKLGMYMGQVNQTTVSTDGLRTIKNESVPSYGGSTIVECSCCK